MMVVKNNKKRHPTENEGNKSHTCVNCEKTTITERSMYCTEHFEAFLEMDRYWNKSVEHK